MRFAECNEKIFEGEHNVKTLKIVDIEDKYLECDIYVLFVTPSGKFYISDRLTIENHRAEIKLTSSLTKDYGWLSCQIVATKDGNEYIEPFPIKRYFIHESLEGESGEEEESGLIYSLQTTKADDLMFEDKKISLLANGKKIGKEIDLKDLAKGEEQVVLKPTKLDFPNVGKIGVIYVSEAENATFRWDDKKLQYISTGRDYNEIEVINGGV